LAAAGLPMIQRANPDAVVATQSLAQRMGIGLFYETIGELAGQMQDHAHMQRVRDRVWGQRDQFCFDTHVPALVSFFRTVINEAGGGPRTAP
jgi:ATP adenylyltransferase/5',5'''-P-1,P-4-tetraphosphate phosphorylase II